MLAELPQSKPSILWVIEGSPGWTTTRSFAMGNTAAVAEATRPASPAKGLEETPTAGAVIVDAQSSELTTSDEGTLHVQSEVSMGSGTIEGPSGEPLNIKVFSEDDPRMAQWEDDRQFWRLHPATGCCFAPAGCERLRDDSL
eukprot:Skav230605  [mRNA]  locus=scaffold168:194795:202530:- [translate_table: standard]